MMEKLTTMLRTGLFTRIVLQDEKKIFFDRLAEVGANGQWGLFSMTIPGRVGYQVNSDYKG